MAEKAYVVERDCCLSGNCFHCRNLTPFGKPARVVHSSYDELEQARKVAYNWRSYNASVIYTLEPVRS